MQDFVRRKHKKIPIEVETRTLEEVKEVLQFLESDKNTLVKRLMLDNMTKLDSNAPGKSSNRGWSILTPHSCLHPQFHLHFLSRILNSNSSCKLTSGSCSW